jgi:hypothetical protein
MKVSIHLRNASRGMTLRNLDIGMALALCAALRGLPGRRIDATIVGGNLAARRATRTLRHSLVHGSTDAFAGVAPHTL